MGVDYFRVRKKTNTYTDALVAQGLADLVVDISFQADVERRVEIIDEGEVFAIKMVPSFEQTELNRWEANPGYRYIKVKNDDAEAPLGAIDYEREREVEKVYKESQKTNTRKNKKEREILREQGLEGLPPEPIYDLPVLKTFNSMRMGSDAYNKLYRAISDNEGIKEILVHKLSQFGLAGAINQGGDDSHLQNTVSSLQLFNPIAGKGINRPKPDSTSPASISSKLVDWFEEWMKYRALHLGLISYNCGNDGKDTKVMVLAPGEISIDQVSFLRDDLLKKKIWGKTSTWLDIQVALVLVKTLIEHSEELNPGGKFVKLRGRRPNKVIKGFFSTYFKNLGTASAVINISFVGLPGWFPVANSEQAKDWLAILKEHENCLKSLDERYSSDVPLLMKYRDFLSSGEWMEFLDFLALYANHYMQLKAQNKWVEAFTTINLRRLFMRISETTKEIIENQGFRNIATAIRKATINAQIRKSITGKSPFEIRYGLAQNWKRKAKFKRELIIELSSFVQEYNNENARHAEQNKETRKNITTQDLEQVIELIENDKYGSELVCMLLLSFGYALEPKEAQENKI
ncbi:MAG: hypothetical protein ACYDG6_04635 [Thermincolia bacterium]